MEDVERDNDNGKTAPGPLYNLPWPRELVESRIAQRRFSRQQLAYIVTTRAGNGFHFSKTYVVKALNGTLRASRGFIEALATELNLPIGDIFDDFDEYILSRLDDIEQGVAEVKELIKQRNERKAEVCDEQ
jgi:hypothetical protein